MLARPFYRSQKIVCHAQGNSRWILESKKAMISAIPMLEFPALYKGDLMFKSLSPKKSIQYLTVAALGSALCLQACAKKGETPVSQQSNTIEKISLGIQGYEFGPAVNKLIIELEAPASSIDIDQLSVETVTKERKVADAYLSDDKGNPSTAKESQYITLDLEVAYSQETFSGLASPFAFNFNTFMNEWVGEYPVKINDLKIGEDLLSKEEDAIANKVIPEVDQFSVRKTVEGNYLNPLTKAEEAVALNYAAFEPETIKEGEKNPLLIWLHGQGEGGTDIAITLLGNEVTALARPEIQDQFTSGDEVGAYVLAVQTPTYWMDEGDETNGAGAGVSRYTEILMDAISNYVASNPDIDPNRIYLSGCSNGGYMTLNMAIHYPDYFAALVPNAPAYAYYNYDKNPDGTYKKVKNEETGFDEAVRLDTVWFDQEKVDKIKNIPMWFIHSADDTTVAPENYPLPVYKALLEAGADNAWFSYYESVLGKDQADTTYMGHWSWIYYFNNQANGVQNPEEILANPDHTGFKPDNQTLGGSQTAQFKGQDYQTVFEWLNAQSK